MANFDNMDDEWDWGDSTDTSDVSYANQTQDWDATPSTATDTYQEGTDEWDWGDSWDEPVDGSQQSNFDSSGQLGYQEPAQEQSADDYWEQENLREEAEQPVNTNRREFNLNKWLVLIVVCGVCIVLGIIFIGLQRFINRPKAPKQQVAVKQQVSVQSNPNQAVTTKQEKTSSTAMTLVGDNIQIETDNAIQTVAGIVTSKERYLQGNQLHHCLNIGISENGVNKDIKYYCSSDVYGVVEEGSILTVTYTYVSEKCFTVLSVSQ